MIPNSSRRPQLSQSKTGVFAPTEIVKPSETSPAQAMPEMDEMQMPEMKFDKAGMSPQKAHTDAMRVATRGFSNTAKMKMGGQISTASKVFVSRITVAMLAVGVFIAGRYGDFSMRAGEMKEMPMQLRR